MRIALVSMPFGALDRPSLALGLLQRVLTDAGFVVSTKYLNLQFGRMLGAETYTHLASHFAMGILAGEWIFSQAFYGSDISSWEAYRDGVLRACGIPIPEEDQLAIREAALRAPEFVELCFESADWGAFDLVGFTSTFEQTMASACLARRIKQAHPHVKIVLGGANFEGPMAASYLELFPFVDYVCHGEGENALLELCRGLELGEETPPAGILSQQHREIKKRPPIQDLDLLPVPDYDEFFAAAKRMRMPASVLPVEGSRGCWWGEKSHCTFCGLNGQTMKFRQKTPDRMAAEMALLTDRYHPTLLCFADNILSLEHFKTVLPFWKETQYRNPAKFFEVKSNLNRTELELLRDAGVTNIQAGIESLLDKTLLAMGKGVTGAHNVALLRWCEELGLTIQWNLLYGFPKEDLADFPVLCELVSQLGHLRPPGGCYRIRMDRFSPNFERYREHGFTEVYPMPAYAHVFAGSEEQRTRLAYFFDYRHAHTEALPELTRPLHVLVNTWCSKDKKKFEVQRQTDGGWVLVDSRSGHEVREEFTETQVEVLLACDAPIGRRRLESVLETSSIPQWREVLEGLEARGCVISCSNRLLTLPLLREEVRQCFTAVKRAPNHASETATFPILQAV